ncbi:MAG TPA: nitroreductase family deazaflavin-dependent oxidoreductase [Acidimicrobiales bacterium]|nr:nitroreductase family deazaflavin-dependent oxidoreductase [Acidimicrobiales bacterium]
MADRRDPVAKIVNTLHRTLFTATKGRVGGKVMGMEAVILTTTGRKSGEKRQSMLTAPIAEGDKVVLVASYGGGPKHPQWYLNLQANPSVEITRAGKTTRMTARTASSEERAEMWPRVTAAYKGYAGYQEKTDREIPLVVFEPA